MFTTHGDTQSIAPRRILCIPHGGEQIEWREGMVASHVLTSASMTSGIFKKSLVGL